MTALFRVVFYLGEEALLYDAAIIGAGVTGCAAARELARYKLKTVILEKSNDVAAGASRANSGIVHAGYDCPPNSLMAKLNVAGNALMESLCSELDVGFRRIGSLVVAYDEDGSKKVQELYEKGMRKGVTQLQIITGEEAEQMEPMLKRGMVCALHAPTAGIVCPYQLTIAMAENAIHNGVRLCLNTSITSILKTHKGFKLTAQNGETFHARYIVNAAGVYADAINALAGAEEFHITPRKGEYLLFERGTGDAIKHVIFQTPTPMGKGILLTTTVDGNLLAGPTAVDIADKEDVETTYEGGQSIERSMARLAPGLKPGGSITRYAGLRAVIKDRDDFLIEASKKMPGWITVGGICSPGLTSAPAIGKYVVELLHSAGLEMEEKKNFDPIRHECKAFRDMNDEERIQAIRKDPLYGRILCRCEMVSEAEIMAALHSSVPAQTLDAIKRRTRAGMGRCQSGFCMDKVMKVIARERGIPFHAIIKGDEGSFIIPPDARKEAK